MKDRTFDKLFVFWFIFCALVGIAMLTGLGLLMYAGYQYLNRH